MKEITITVPDNCELKQDGNTYTIVEKEKKLTYVDIAKELFKDNQEVWYIDDDGSVQDFSCEENWVSPNNSTSERQLEKLLAINKLMNIAKYLNGDWQPDWDDTSEAKYCIAIEDDEIKIEFTWTECYLDILFKSEELAQQAIEILGEETIKLALCTDY